MTATGEREKQWLDDLIAVVASVMNHVRPDQIVQGCAERAIRLALRFCWTSEVAINGKVLRKWSLVRRELRSEMVRAHSRAWASVPGLPDPDTASSEQITSAVLAMFPLEELKLCADDADDPKATPTHEMQLLEQFSQDQSTISSLVTFLEENIVTKAGVSLKFQPTYQIVCANAAKALPGFLDRQGPGSKGTLLLRDVVQFCHEQVLVVVEEKWMGFAALALVIMEQTKVDIADASCGIFTQIKILESFLLLPSKYMIELLSSLIAGQRFEFAFTCQRIVS